MTVSLPLQDALLAAAAVQGVTLRNIVMSLKQDNIQFRVPGLRRSYEVDKTTDIGNLMREIKQSLDGTDAV